MDINSSTNVYHVCFTLGYYFPVVSCPHSSPQLHIFNKVKLKTAFCSYDNFCFYLSNRNPLCFRRQELILDSKLSLQNEPTVKLPLYFS